MIPLVHCLLLLIGLVGLPVGAFLVSPVLGIVLGILAVVASIPLLLSAFGHYDLLRMKARYGLSEDELDEFMRLVPRISNGPAMAGMAPGERRRHARDTAAGMVRAGRRGGR